jgi:DNA topoisomerase I
MIIAEKPKVAEKIANFLGDNVKRKNIKGISYYETSYGNDKLIVVSAVGHIFSLEQRSKGYNIPVFDIEWVPAYKSNKQAAYTKDYIDLISKLSSECNLFVSACDYDIEGSLIGYNAIRFAAGSEEGMRMKFSALTKNDIINAYENMTELDYSNAIAGETRHMLDWYWGINISRALSQCARNSGLRKNLSIGRVQGPSLDILVKREKEIQSFVSKPYWQLFALYKKTVFVHEREKFWDETEAEKAFKNSDKKGKVKSMDVRDFNVSPPVPFDLTSLQIEAYRVHRFSPKDVLSLTQTLYENSMISYPRTSSQQYPPSIDLKSIIQSLSKNNLYSKEANFLIKNNKYKPNNGKKSDPAHPAIHPTGVQGNVGERERKLYDLIVRRFLACFGDPATKQSTKVVLRLGDENYVGKGIIVLNPGWIDLYGKYYTPDEEVLPKMQVGEQVNVDKLKKEEKKTQPPKRYTATSLIKVLEKYNLGTKATRATIIDILFKREYVKSKSIEVSLLGMAVHETLSKYCKDILDENLTREFEEKVVKIQEKKEKEENVINDAKKIILKIIDDFKKNSDNIGKELRTAYYQSERMENYVMPCDKCKTGSLIIRPTRDKRIFIGCSNYPNCKNAYPLPSTIKKAKFVEKCPKCGGPIMTYTLQKRKVVKCANSRCV